MSKLHYPLTKVSANMKDDGTVGFVTLSMSDQPDCRFQTSYQGITLLIGNLMGLARQMTEALVRSGEADAQTTDTGKLLPFQVLSARSGRLEPDNQILLSLQTTEGPMFDFLMPPETARMLLEALNLPDNENGGSNPQIN